MPAAGSDFKERDSVGFLSPLKRSVYRYGIIRYILTLPLLLIFIISYAILIPEYQSRFHIQYDQINRIAMDEKRKIMTPAVLSSDLFYYSRVWQDISGEDNFTYTLIYEGMENLYKSLSFLKDIQDNDETAIRDLIRQRLRSNDPHDQDRTDPSTGQKIYESIISRGEYFSRLFDQLFAQHGLKKLEDKYTDTDVEIFFSILFKNQSERIFRRLLGALVMNVPYYLVIKNSVSEYYQNNDILIPVDLFTITLFMMYLDELKNSKSRPAIEECRRWVFSVLAPENGKNYDLRSRSFSVQPVIREEMIMPNPGYFSKAYHPKKHRAIDIASERGTMIRSPVTGTVNYYEKSPKKYRTGNFIIIKDDKSNFNIFICHMDNKDYIEEHSTEGELAAPIANLSPDWTHPLKKGQFFQVVGNLGKSTGAHTHIQIARRVKPYDTYDFFAVNEPYRKKFSSYLFKNGYWHIYSRNEQLLLSVLGMFVLKYDSTRHFSDRDPLMLELYRQLQINYTPVSVTVEHDDFNLVRIPENILRSYFSKEMQQRAISERYDKQLKYNASMAMHIFYMLKLSVPLADRGPQRGIPLTPWRITGRRDEEDGDSAQEMRSILFYQALNKYFLYIIMKLEGTPRTVRESLLSDPMFTGSFPPGFCTDFPSDETPGIENRLSSLENFIKPLIDRPPDLSFILEQGFCEKVFSDITSALASEGIFADSTFGFFRYHMTELQKIYQSTGAIRSPDIREFTYNSRFDDSVREFVLGLLELSAENRYYDLFRRMYCTSEELHSPFYSRIAVKIKKRISRLRALIKDKLFGIHLPGEPGLAPQNFHSELQGIIRSAVKTVPYRYRIYTYNVYYCAAVSSLVYSFIYEVYTAGRERYMRLFPEDQLRSVIDAIGLFDGMLKVFCDNAARKQIITNEHSRITRELENMERELESYRKSKRELQDNFIRESSATETSADHAINNPEIIANYFSEEEKLSRTISQLEQSLESYRYRYNTLKNEKDELEREYTERISTMNREVDNLKSKSMLDERRFITEIEGFTFQRERLELQIAELKSRISVLTDDNRVLDSDIRKLSEIKSATENRINNLYKKIDEQEKTITELGSKLAASRKIFNSFVDSARSAIGNNADNLTPDEIITELKNIIKSSILYSNTARTIRLLQEQQKSDKRSLALNADLITDLKNRVEKLELQLRYLRDTTPSEREKDLERENDELSEIIRELRSSQQGKNRKQQT